MNAYSKWDIIKIFEFYSFLIEKIHMKELSTTMFQETKLLEEAALNKGFIIFHSKRRCSLSLVFFKKQASAYRKYWYLSYYA